MAFNPNQLARIAAAIHRAYSDARVPLTWRKADINAELPVYDTYLDTEQLTANNTFSASFRGKSTAADRRTIDIVVRMARYLVANPQYIAVLKVILREIEGVDSV